MGKTTEEDEVYAPLEGESREGDVWTGHSDISRGDFCHCIRDNNSPGNSTTL